LSVRPPRLDPGLLAGVKRLGGARLGMPSPSSSVVRAAEFRGDKRKIMDFRRSGSVEAIAGEAPPAVLAAKMANTIDQNKELQATNLPHQVAVVRLADAARAQGRSRLRGENKSRPKS
jgi:hypothetical protein